MYGKVEDFTTRVSSPHYERSGEPSRDQRNQTRYGMVMEEGGEAETTLYKRIEERNGRKEQKGRWWRTLEEKISLST